MISDLNSEPITGSFCEKELQKTSQEKFRVEKVIKRKGDQLYVKQKGYDNSFNRLIENTLYFPKLLRSFGGNSNVKIDLSNYATKTDPKNVNHVNTSNFGTENKFSQPKN